MSKLVNEKKLRIVANDIREKNSTDIEKEMHRQCSLMEGMNQKLDTLLEAAVLTLKEAEKIELMERQLEQQKARLSDLELRVKTHIANQDIHQ